MTRKLMCDVITVRILTGDALCVLPVGFQSSAATMGTPTRHQPNCGPT
jgi:hypothetical protein